MEVARSAFLDLVSNFKSHSLVPWVFGGDINMIRYPHEKKGGNFVAQSMKLFSNFINDNGLIDLPLLRRRFTWSNNREQVAMSRIDKFLLSKECDEHFDGVI